MKLEFALEDMRMARACHGVATLPSTAHHVRIAVACLSTV